MKSYHLTAILNITTGRLLSSMYDIYDVLNHITGDNLFTHQLPRACRFAAPILLAKYPELSVYSSQPAMDSLTRWLSIPGDETPENRIQFWLAEMQMMHPDIPKEFEVECHSDSWLRFDPVDELLGMVDPEKVSVVQMEGSK